MNQTGTGSTAPQSSTPPSKPVTTDEVKRGADQIKDTVLASLDDVKGTVKEGANTVMQGLSSAASDARQQAVELASEAKTRAYSIAEQQKNVGADQIGGIANAVRSAADELSDRAPSVAKYVQDAASGIEKVSDELRNKSVDDVIRSVEHFARTQPVAFFSVAALAGFAISRFVKSSADRRAAMNQPMQEHGDFRPQQGSYQPRPVPAKSPVRSSGTGTTATSRPASSSPPLQSSQSPSANLSAASAPPRKDHSAGSVTSRGAEPVVSSADPKLI